ncbi:MAG: ROK family protein, partial [Acidobacteriota bacterium]|nr:ROK family protein [Acidobacteriota bacterium]
WPSDEERPGAVCYCGRRGCIETFLSGPGLARDFVEHGGPALESDAVIHAARTGDASAAAALDRYLDRLARSLATVINVLDPDIIVVGGGLSNVVEIFEEVPRRWARYVFSDRVDTRLVGARHGDSSGVRGAARLWSA